MLPNEQFAHYSSLIKNLNHVIEIKIKYKKSEEREKTIFLIEIGCFFITFVIEYFAKNIRPFIEFEKENLVLVEFQKNIFK